MKNASINLELLQFFSTLAESGSVASASKRLNISQASGQRQLERLRDIFSDPLFMKTGSGVSPTPLSLRVLPRINTLISELENLVAERTFDPSKAINSFSLATKGHAVLCMMGPVLQRFTATAPNARLNIRTMGLDILDRLEFGSIDLAIYGGKVVHEDCHEAILASHGYSLLMRADHPLAQRTAQDEAISLREFERSRRLLINPRLDRRPVGVEVYSGSPASDAGIVTSTEQFLSGAMLLLDADLIAVFPSPSARRLAKIGPWAVRPLPWTSNRFEVRMVWHHRVHHDPALTWLRRLIIDTTVELRDDAGGQQP